MARRRKPKRAEVTLVTADIRAAFEAALKLFEYKPWESPEGPAIVREVNCLVGGGYGIKYRLIADWGKEAW